MALVVKVAVKGKVDDVLADVKKVAASKEIKFTGDAEKGNFAGRGIEGNYAVNGQEITITVTKTPVFAPDALIKKAITDWFIGK